jgi:hypothetical protein
MDGYSTRHPVIVVNPQGLLQEPSPEYGFEKKPVLNLVFDRDMMRQVVEEVISSMGADSIEDEIAGWAVGNDSPATELESVTDDDLEALTKPDESDEPRDGTVAPETNEPEFESGSAIESATDSVDDQAQAEETAAEGTEAPVVESKGKGRRRAGINDEDI